MTVALEQLDRENSELRAAVELANRINEVSVVLSCDSPRSTCSSSECGTPTSEDGYRYDFPDKTPSECQQCSIDDAERKKSKEIEQEKDKLQISKLLLLSIKPNTPPSHSGQKHNGPNNIINNKIK